ncbi:uncharacterized protein [Lepeophtheirus salmonis]|uniref:uncharacterized protein n=1 Tax=Lepeophtheirus salmonis TaxID=72036 RepID=UPI003AF3EBE8
MGIRADEFIPTLGDRKNVKFYLDTGKSSPYCKNHYLLEINLAKSDEAEQWVQGFMKTNLYGSKGELMDVDLTPDGSTKFVHGTKIKRLISTNSDLGNVNLVHIEWNYDHDINPLDLGKVCVLLCSDKIYLRSVSVIDDQNQSENHVVCGNSSVNSSDQICIIPSGKSKLFYQPCKPFVEEKTGDDRKFLRKPKSKFSFFKFPF